MGDEGKLDYNLTVKVNEGYNASSELLRSFGDDSRLVAMLAAGSAQDNIDKVLENLTQLSSVLETSPGYARYIQLGLESSLYAGNSDNPTLLLDPSIPVALGCFVDSPENTLAYVLTPGATIIHAYPGYDTTVLDVRQNKEFGTIIKDSIKVEKGEVVLLTTDQIFEVVPQTGILGILKGHYKNPDKIDTITINQKIIDAAFILSGQNIKREDVPLVVIKVGDIEYRADVTLEGVDSSFSLVELDNPDITLEDVNPDDSRDGIEDAELSDLMPLAAVLGGARYDDDRFSPGDSAEFSLLLDEDDQTTTDPHRYAVAIPDLKRTDEHHAVVVNDLDIDTDDDIPVDARTWDLADETHAHDPPGLRDSAFPTQLDRQYAVLERSLERISQERDRFHSRAEEAEDLLAEAQGSLRSLGEQCRQLETNRDQWEEGYRGLDIDLTALEGDYKSLEAQLADKDKELTNVQIKLARYKEERRLRINLLPKRKSLIRRLGSALTTSLDYITKPLLNKSRFKLFVGIDAILIGAALAASVAVNGTYQPVLDHAEAFKYELQSRHVINTHPQEASCNDARTQFELLEQGVSQEVRATKAFDRAENLESRFLESIDCE